MYYIGFWASVLLLGMIYTKVQFALLGTIMLAESIRRITWSDHFEY